MNKKARQADKNHVNQATEKPGQGLVKELKHAVRSGQMESVIPKLRTIQKEFPFDPWAFEQHAFLALKRKKNYAEAAEISELGLKTNPNSLKLTRTMAEALSYLKGEEGKAKRLFEEVISKSKGIEKVKVLSAYADFLIRQGETQEAEKVYRSILDSNPRDPKARIDLARSLRIQKRYDECLKCLSEDLRPTDPYWLRESGHCFLEKGDVDSATKLLLDARKCAEVTIPPRKLPLYHRRLIPLEKALAALKGEWREAFTWAFQQKYNTLIGTVFLSARKWVISNDQIDACILFLTELLEKDQENLAIPYQIELLINRAGYSPLQLLKVYEKLLDVAPHNLGILASLAHTYQDSDAQLAEHYFQDLWETAGRVRERAFFPNVITWAAVWHSQFLRKHDRYEDAYLIIEEARTRWNASSWELDLERAICLFRLSSYAEAYDILIGLDATRKDNPVVLDQMGACLRAFGEFDKALEVFGRKTELYPEDVFGFQGLGSTLYDSGRYDEALEVFLNILRDHPDDVEAKWTAALIYQQKGEYQKAKLLLRDIDPLSLIQRGKSQRSIENKLAEVERQRLEQQAELEEARKLGYLGMMATATAHELNQPIGIIRASADAALRDMEEGYFKQEETKPLLEKVLAQTERLAAIVEHFRRFAKGDRAHREKVLLNDLVSRTTANFLEQFRHRNILLTTELWHKTPRPVAWANMYQLEEVLINLLTNARDAVEGKKDAKVWVKTWRIRGGRAGFSVEDNGPGLPQEYRKNMFVPFFSTKPTEKGTGLGLYISRRIIDGLGGQLRYKDRKYGGAVFSVNLPPLKG